MNTNYISPTLQRRGIFWETKNTLHIFNPEHDLALGSATNVYTAPAEIVKLRISKSLLPALYADNGDFILISDKEAINNLQLLEHYNLVKAKKINPVTYKDLPSVNNKIKNVLPWGWDPAIIKTLRDYGLDSTLCPGSKSVADILKLSHRRTTIPFREYICELLEEEVKHPVEEIFRLEDVARKLDSTDQTYYLKAPWSSSGRGIVVTDHISRRGLMEWCHGTICRQGSVIMEKAWDRDFDFATEWWLTAGDINFLGFSVFETSSRGKYHGNVIDSQKNIESLIRNRIPVFDERILAAQKMALQKFISHSYEGPVGIDMFSDKEGDVNYCVEINLRLTMGHIPIISQKDFNSTHKLW